MDWIETDTHTHTPRPFALPGSPKWSTKRPGLLALCTPTAVDSGRDRELALFETCRPPPGSTCMQLRKYLQHGTLAIICAQELRDRGHNRHATKRRGGAVPLSRAELGTRLTQCAWAEVYFRTKWHLYPSSRLATKDMGPKLGVCALWGTGSWVPI